MGSGALASSLGFSLAPKRQGFDPTPSDPSHMLKPGWPIGVPWQCPWEASLLQGLRLKHHVTPPVEYVWLPMFACFSFTKISKVVL